MRHLTAREMADDMADRIRRGEYVTGQRLPAAPVLAGVYGVSHSTIQRACRLLVDRNLINVAPGRGFYVGPAGQVHVTADQIAEEIAGKVQRGECPADARLPSYRELADRYGVSISTAQRAYFVLADRGVIRGEPGRGTFVAPRPTADV